MRHHYEIQIEQDGGQFAFYTIDEQGALDVYNLGYGLVRAGQSAVADLLQDDSCTASTDLMRDAQALRQFQNQEER